MSKATCSERDCTSKVSARGLCNRHYLRLHRQGLFQPELPFDRHALSEVDTEARQAICAICGPTRIRVGGGRSGNQCATGRAKQRPAGDAGTLARVRDKYRLSADEVDRMRAHQDATCAICKRQAERLVVDHDHACCAGSYTCGRCIRGLLCHRCNVAIGWFGDDREILLAAVEYLSAPPASAVLNRTG